MSKNHNNNTIENRIEKLVDITKEYKKNERPHIGTTSLADDAIGRVKAETKAVIKKVKDINKDLNTGNNIEKNNLRIKRA